VTLAEQKAAKMSSHTASTIFVIGGTGAQGIPIIRDLVSDKKYSVRFLSRDPASGRATDLLALDNVSVLEGSFADEAALREGFRDCDGAFVNIDGFHTGEKSEIYLAMRSYEIAIEEGVKFFVYGNLDYGFKKSGYDSRFRTGHYDGKGRVGEWILLQNQANRDRMGAAVFTTGPYIEMTISRGTPMSPTVEDGVVTWRVPLGEGAVVHVSLEDCGYYVRWLFDHPERANGLDLEVAVDHIAYADLAAAFEKVTGHPARYVDTDLETYWKSGPLSPIADGRTGVNADLNDKSTMKIRDNFTGFWNLWKHGIVERDYALLDEIHPNRIKSAEEWFRREEKLGQQRGQGSLWERVQPANQTSILKFGEDMRAGKL
jgi:NmrA-like family